MNKKLTKLLSVFVIAGAIGTGVAGITACSPKQPETPEHTHTAATEWQKDETGHWHNCTADDGAKLNEGTHVYDNDQDTTCNTCGYERVLTYSISYAGVDGVTNTNPTSYTTESGAITLAAVEKTGYTFDGWYNAANEKVTTIAAGTKGNIALTAKWTAKTYTIEYTGIDGINDTNSNPTTYTIETDTITLESVEKFGFTFDGWYTSAGEKITSIAKGTTGNITLTAKWTSIITSIDVATLNDAPATLAAGDSLQLSAVVQGIGSSGQGVTWDVIAGSEYASVNADGLVSATGNGLVTVEATSIIDNTKSGSITLVIKSSDTSGNATVPTFAGAAAGPQGGTQNVALGFKGSDLDVGAIAGWTDGTFNIISGDARNRVDTSSKYTRSVKNGVITVEVPAGAKLEIVYSSGSSTIGNASYKLTKPDGAVETVVINAADKVLQTLTIESTQAGTYRFEKAGGTVDVWECNLSYTVTSTAIQSIELTSEGITDYLITQKLDCTGVSLVAIDSNKVTHAINLANCTFDTSKYNPAVAGEYEIGVTYHLDSNLESTQTEFTTSYTVKVYQVESISLYTMSFASNKQSSLQQACVTGDTFSKDNLTVMAKCKLGDEIIDYKLKNDWYTISTPALNSQGTKRVQVSVGNIYTVGNKEVKASYDLVVKDKKDVVDNKVEITVGKTGDFATLTQAVQYLKACNYSSSVYKVIKLEAGTYTEKVWLDVDNVTLIGQGATMNDTVVSYSAVEDTVDLATGNKFVLYCATMHVTGKNFKAYNLSIRNDFDYINEASKYGSPQGLALTVAGDGAVLYKTHLYGNQDTLYLKSRAYFYQSQIDGNVDFIFGEAAGLAYFDECKIVAINRSATDKGTDNNGYVTAMKADDKTKPDYGYIFNNCEFTDDGKVADGSMSLGRPWGKKATVAYINCSFTKAYATSGYGSGNKTDRWSSMSGNSPANADFCEYGSTGEGAISEAVAGGSILTAEQAANYTKANIFAATNGLQSSTAFDCDTELTKLKILAGLESGEMPQETTRKADLTDTSLTNGNCVADINTMYGEILTWTGSGSFETAKPTNGVKVGTDTVITFNIVGEVTLVAGYQLPAADYTITYSGGKATVTFSAITGTYGDFIGSIVIDTTKTPADTVA